jgi:hypothetical protein
MPPMRIQNVYWSNNVGHATRRATMSEIEEVLLSRSSSFRRNVAGRKATHIAKGRTAAGRPLVVAFIYQADTRTAIPITAWEDR